MQAEAATGRPAAQEAFPLGRTARIAVLASGRGSNLASLLAAFPAGAAQGELGTIAMVISNKADAPALHVAQRAGVAAVSVPWNAEHPRPQFEAEVARLLDANGIDLVCLAGFMRVLSPAFTARYAGRLLNIHPSLLPDFRGLHAQQQALAAGVSEAGCTVHFVDAGVDTGAAVVQLRVPVLPGDTETTLSERILEAEHKAYPAAVTAVLSGRLR